MDINLNQTYKDALVKAVSYIGSNKMNLSNIEHLAKAAALFTDAFKLAPNLPQSHDCQRRVAHYEQLQYHYAVYLPYMKQCMQL